MPISNSLSLLELLERLDVSPRYADFRPGDQLVFIADTSRAGEDFGWSPTTELTDGLGDLLSWVEQNAETASAILNPA